MSDPKCLGCGFRLTSSDCCDDYKMLPMITCNRMGCVNAVFCPDCYAGHMTDVHGLPALQAG